MPLCERPFFWQPRTTLYTYTSWQEENQDSYTPDSLSQPENRLSYALLDDRNRTFPCEPQHPNSRSEEAEKR
jgi:hypothetical protein